MAKLLIILLIGLTFESAGVVLLKKGMTGIGEVRAVTVREIARVVKIGVKEPKIWLGVFFEALFFASLIILMSQSDISFLWPLTGLSFVFATIAAVIFLGEHVSTLRWMGVILIVIGAALISYSEKKTAPPKPATALVKDSNL
ncbi:MAG TPA: EamA family transporter [Verrucomicrobiae bacterium]|nr:EamA family transporter [Verrucomicrobiae bacterium]